MASHPGPASLYKGKRLLVDQWRMGGLLPYKLPNTWSFKVETHCGNPQH